MIQLLHSYWPLLLGAITGMVATVWGHFRSLLAKCISYVIVVNHVENDLAKIMCQYMTDHYKRSPWATNRYEYVHMFVRSENCSRRVVYTPLDKTPQIFWDRWKPLWAGGINDGKTNSVSTNTFSFIRGTFDFKSIMKAALDFEHDKSRRLHGNRYFVRYCHGMSHQNGGRSADDSPEALESKTYTIGNGMVPVFYDASNLGPRQRRDALDTLSLSAALERLNDEIKFWFDSKQWYQERGIPWRRGYLFHGPPGSGKTSYIRALAETMDLPVFIYDLSSMTNVELISAWNRMLSCAPCVALIEDIDTVFNGRENIANKYKETGGLTFDCLLNRLDGLEANDGILTCITTNNINAVDPALGVPTGTDKSKSSRPGRIDRLIEITHLDHDGRVKIAMRIVKDHDIAVDMARHHASDTAAQFTERCVQMALSMLWQEDKLKIANG